MGLLAGAGAGGAVGGIVGGLIGVGVPEYEAKRYEGRIRKGGILVSVHCDDSEWAKRAEGILDETGAEDISTASEEKADFAKTDKPSWRSLPKINSNRPSVRLPGLLVRDAMRTDVETIPVNALLSEASERMRASNVGVLPVRSGDAIVGLVTDRDITMRVSAEGYSPSHTTVHAAMTTDYSYCFDNQELAEAAKIMKDRRIRRLIVLDGDRRLVGLLSVEDIATRAGDKTLAGDVLQSAIAK
jgi:CBS domain-containing protein